ncbi:MAG TPA: CoA-binding protein [Polyangia bacterium]
MSAGNTIESEEELAEIVRAARTVAVIGMRDESAAGQPAFEIPKSLQGLGLQIRPVNPKLTEVLGERAYPALADLPAAVDIVDVFRRSDAIPGIADEVLALPVDRRPRVFWMQTGIKSDEAAAKLAAAGIKVVQDRCLGVFSRRYRK